MELSIVLKAELLGDFLLMPHCEQAFAYTSVQEYWKGGGMWVHTGDLTACHRYDKAEQ